MISRAECWTLCLVILAAGIVLGVGIMWRARGNR